MSVDPPTGIPGWDHYWHVPDDLTTEMLHDKLKQTAKRFFHVRFHQGHTLLGHTPEYENELPPCLQLLYFTVFFMVKHILKPGVTNVHYRGKHDIVSLMIAAAVHYVSDVDGIPRTIFVSREAPLKHDALGFASLVEKPDIATIKYLTPAPDGRSQILAGVDNLKGRRTGEHVEYQVKQPNPNTKYPFARIRLKKDPGQNPFAFVRSMFALRKSGKDKNSILELTNEARAGMGHVAWLSCLILVLPRFRLIIKTHPVYNKLVQYALDANLLETLEIETLKSAIAIPQNTELSSVTFRYLPYYEQKDGSVSDLEPFFVSLANRRSHLPVVEIQVLNGFGDARRAHSASLGVLDFELQVLCRLVDIAMNTTSIGKIIPQFRRFLSLFSNPIAFDKMLAMYHYNHTVGLLPHRMVGRDVCFLQLDPQYTHLGYSMIYEMLNTRVFAKGNTKMRSEFILKNYLWGVYQKMFSLAHGTDEWPIDDENDFRHIHTIEEYTAEDDHLKVIMTKEVFDAYYNLQFAPPEETDGYTDDEEEAEDELVQLRHEIVQYGSPEWKLLPMETFTFLCRLMLLIGQNIRDRTGALYDFDLMIQNIDARSTMYTRDEEQYLASRTAFEKLDDIFGHQFAAQFLYRLSLNEWGQGFLAVLQANPSNAERFLKIQFYQSDERYRPSDA